MSLAERESGTTAPIAETIAATPSVDIRLLGTLAEMLMAQAAAQQCSLEELLGRIITAHLQQQSLLEDSWQGPIYFYREHPDDSCIPWPQALAWALGKGQVRHLADEHTARSKPDIPAQQ